MTNAPCFDVLQTEPRTPYEHSLYAEVLRLIAQRDDASEGWRRAALWRDALVRAVMDSPDVDDAATVRAAGEALLRRAEEMERE